MKITREGTHVRSTITFHYDDGREVTVRFTDFDACEVTTFDGVTMNYVRTNGNEIWWKSSGEPAASTFQAVIDHADRHRWDDAPD